jgi:hypothetical protein
LSDTWEFTGGVWRQLAADGGIPQQGELIASDPALDAVVLVGQSLAYTASSVPGTWKWTSQGWSQISATTPTGTQSLGYDPLSHRLLAYGGQAPFTPERGLGQSSTGYSRTWAFDGSQWQELHPVTTPDRAPGTLTASPDGRLLMLINTSGQTWTWTGQDWQRYPTHGGPAADHSPWNDTTLSAATSPSRDQIVLLATGSSTNDQTWTLHGNEWTNQPATP